ncbi:MAG: YIP1 family protein [Chloroflexaceae bacterium]|jgi:hypothetical protein|nr:YIP1 family protein [Chloroflexaceae bacterium]
MQALSDLFRLGIGGLFLETPVFREQREASNRMQRGFLLVLLVGVLVGLAAFVGQLLTLAITPSVDTIFQTLRNGLTAMPWYRDLSQLNPAFPAQFDQAFAQAETTLRTLNSGLLGGLAGVILTPLVYLITWLIFGAFAHVVARMLGGQGSFSQTLGCTALASGVNLLALVQIVPAAQVAGVTLLGLLANYVAIREAHQLQPWRAFWATLLGPLVLVLLFTCAICLLFFSLGNILSNLGLGA